MPTYEFRCPSGHDFEKFYRSIAAAPGEVTCPQCGKVAVRQMSAGGGLVFKGSGFYITDYGKDGKKSQAASPPAASKSETTGEKSAATGDSGSAGSENKTAGDARPAASDSSPAAPPAPKSTKSPKPSE